MKANEFFMRISRISRGNCLRLGVPRCRLVARKNFFSIRVINVWNELPYEIVMAHNVLEFKIKLDKFLKKNNHEKQRFIKDFVLSPQWPLYSLLDSSSGIR